MGMRRFFRSVCNSVAMQPAGAVCGLLCAMYTLVSCLIAIHKLFLHKWLSQVLTSTL
jgi:hypothetical protein